VNVPTAAELFVDPSPLVGAEETSAWLTIDQEHLSEFGHSTYLDPAYVDLTPSRNHALGPELVDGFMLLSLLVYFDFSSPLLRTTGGYGFNYGLDRVRFVEPVYVGERVRVRREVVTAEPKSPSRLRLAVDITMEVNREEPETVMVARWITMVVDGQAEAAGVGGADL
jgi:acyl dehydratase